VVDKVSAGPHPVVKATGIPLAAWHMVCAMLMFLTASPTLAAAACPANYQNYSFQGTVAETGTTADGRPFYVIGNITDAACGDEHQRIRAYPLASVSSCVVGKPVQASGVYTKSCVDVGKLSICLVQVGLRDANGAIDTTKGAAVSCK
jgi:spore maturation protein SpmB